MKRLLFYLYTFCLCTLAIDSSGQDICRFELEEGQIERYILFTSSNLFTSQDSAVINYTGDTLIVEVLEEIDQNTFIIKEYFSPHSNIFTSTTNYIYGSPEDIYEVQWTFANDSLLIENPSSSFWQASHLTYFAEGVSLDPPFTNMVTFFDWKPIPTFGSHTYNRIINGQEYNRLIVHVDNSQIAVDGPGMSMTYEKAHGIASSFMVSAWTGGVQGWMKL